MRRTLNELLMFRAVVEEIKFRVNRISLLASMTSGARVVPVTDKRIKRR